MIGKIGSKTRLQHIFFATSLYNTPIMKNLTSILKFDKSKTAKFRLKVIEFHDKFGSRTTIAAYGVSKATIFRWKKRFNESQQGLQSLIPCSREPKRKRTMQTHPKVLAYIKLLREKHFRLGKEKIKPLLDKYCFKNNLPCISESTIGKVIKKHNLFYSQNRRMYHNPGHGWAKRKKSRYKIKVKRSPKPKDFGYVEIDTMFKFYNGLKVYILNAIDIKLKFQFSYAYTKLNSQVSLDFLKKLQLVYPLKGGIKTIQTDNGLEFHGVFAKYLKKRKIKHLYIYPRCPKINAFVERANRSLREEFVNPHINSLLDGLEIFNHKLMEYLVWYNTKRVHKGLNNLSPIDYLLKTSPESQMYVTYTPT